MQKTTSAILITLIVAAVVPASGHASTARDTGTAAWRQDKPQDVSGAWALTVDTGQGTGTPSVTFKQDGEKLTGTYSSQVFGEQQVTGTIKGNAITFSFTAALEGNKLTVTYTGTVEKDTMKGKVTLGDLGEGTFTGNRKK
jgi:hypothetical protein